MILHYTVAGQNQQNLTMTYNSGAGQWQYTAGGLSPGTNVTYSFTYNKGGSQYDTGTYSWTAGNSAPTPTPTPATCNGNFSPGVANTGATTALIVFQPCGWTAGYVILHYTLAGQGQQNLNMSYNSSAGRWEYSVGGFSAGQTVTFSYTYQKSGLQYDSGTYSWTHP